MNILITIGGLLSCLMVVLAYTSDELDEWVSYKANYGKVYYGKEQDEIRMKTFLENKRIIEEHNELYDNGLKSYRLGLNRYADMTLTELKKTTGGYQNEPRKQVNRMSIPQLKGGFPRTVDWRAKGAITEVKDQEGCDGADWAFSVTGSLESQHFLKNGKLVTLSEQNLIDCSSTSNTCDGGTVEQAFEYVKNNGGIDEEEAYPYKGEDGTCGFLNDTVGASLSNYISLPSGDELALQFAVAVVGPISAHIYISGEWMFYQEGIFDKEPCPNRAEDLNHYVLIAGYGTENGTDYWLVKNSWSNEWGEEGYIKMARKGNNYCGIATNAIYPEVK